MSIIEIILIAVSLAMDAFAASLCRGVSVRKLKVSYSVQTALCFGFFQALMPFLGWAMGIQFTSYITGLDHWIAFGLLLIIGVNMIVESRKNDEECQTPQGCKALVLMGLATSIDALAVGVSFAVLPKVNIFLSCAIIGSVTFVIAFVGVYIGNKFGSKYKTKAELVGGLVLIGIGLRILISHLISGI